MKRKELIELVRGSKIYVNGKSEEIQKFLFKLGASWSGGKNQVAYTNAPFLYINKNLLLEYGENMNNFIKPVMGREIKEDFLLSQTIEEDEYEFQSFDKVLIRDSKTDVWEISLFGRHARYLSNVKGYRTMEGKIHLYCIPFKGNEHLLGTTDEEGKAGTTTEKGC